MLDKNKIFIIYRAQIKIMIYCSQININYLLYKKYISIFIVHKL